MSDLIKAYYEKLLLAVAAAVLAVSCAWLWQQQPALRRVHAMPVAPRLADSRYTPVDRRPPEPVATVWPEAPDQSSGRGWRYEVFTPPEIHYDPLAKSFTVRPSVSPGADAPPAGLELLAVKPEEYRLQLAGYFGGPGDYLAAFVGPNLPETLLAREGSRFDALGLTLKRFEVKKVPVGDNDVRPAFDIAALAIVQDDRTGADVVLDSRTRKFTDRLLAVLKLPTGDGEPRELHEGDSLSDETSTYRVERIRLDPPEVVVARETPGLPGPEIRILRPVEKAGGQVAGRTANPNPFSGRAGAAVAINGK